MVKWGAGCLAAALALVVLSLAVARFWLLPNLAEFKPRLEQELTAATGHAIRIGALRGEIDGWRVSFELRDVRIANPASGRDLSLSSIVAQPAWASLWHAEPRFALLALRTPSLELWRDAAGRLFVNGIEVQGGESDGRLFNWLLRQDEIDISDAAIRWRDDYAGVAALDLSHGQLKLTHGLLGHTLDLTATPPADWFDRFRLHLKWRGGDVKRWQEWKGSLALEVGGAKFAPWQRYLGWMAKVPAGEGGATVAVDFEGDRLVNGTARFDLRNTLMKLNPDEPPVRVARLSGELGIERNLTGTSTTLKARDLVALTEAGAIFDHAQIDGSWSEGAKGQGRLALSRADLAALRPLIRALPLGENRAWRALDPGGFVEAVELSWRGDVVAPSRWTLAGRFRNLGWHAVGELPGISGLSGSIDASEAGGRLRLADRDGAVLDMPRVFLAPLAIERAEADIGWTRRADRTEVQLNKVDIANHDLSASVRGSYRYAPAESEAGVIDLSATIPQVAAAAVPKYMPLVVGENTRAWLSMALKAGQARDARLVLKGNLDHFPFARGGGEFSVITRAQQVTLDYAPGWPAIDKIDGELRFLNEKMEIDAPRAEVFGVALGPVRVGIPDLGAHAPHLTVDGQAAGQTADFVRYLRASRLNAILGGFPDRIRAGGSGKLALKLDIPLAHAVDTRVEGGYRFVDNRLELGRGIPPLARVSGELRFSERGVASDGIQYQALGGAGRLSAATDARGKMNFVAGGQADSREALALYLPLAAAHVGGATAYRTAFTIGKGLETLQLDSRLVGVSTGLPAPLAKRAEEALPLVVTLKPGPDVDRLGIKLGSEADANILLGPGGDVARGVVRVGGGSSALPRAGLAINIVQPSIDAAPWLALLDQKAEPAADAGAGSLPLSINLKADELRAFGRRLDNARLAVSPRDGGWEGRIAAREMDGSFVLAPGGRKVTVRLNALSLPLPPDGQADSAAGADADLPGLDVQVERLTWRGREAGRLALQAERHRSGWQLGTLSLVNADGSLTASGDWKDSGGAGESQLHARFDSANLGQWLQRVGEPNLLKNGRASLDSQLRWRGRMYAPELGTLTGQLDLAVDNGQFSKVEPGMGRLLGLVSLQSLGRRLRLDFRDVFGDGFAFDTLRGILHIDQGVVRSDDLNIKGPAAEISLSGSANIKQDSQSVRVRVEPHLSEGVALAAGAVLLNPVVGVATLAAQKVLQNPMGKLFSSEYLVTGSLADPQIAKVEHAAGAQSDKQKVKP